MTVIKTAISITPELYSALTRTALQKGNSVSRQIEICLRENPSIQKYLREVEAEPIIGVHLVHPRKVAPVKSRRGRRG